ncbi:hypothetical protein C3369_07600 [Escherichia sp. ESNIH1]|uniref:hypothetical protein n=1 Tax=Escherichia sp. ESNIH1 TaxID=1985876 RepID=UPI000CDDFA95|nr:hypothetical protein [Escherichia sp. ESNIH1]POU02322.1 hypothetical protein C3369_07600 [Escherichia sp. ESNIH1]
MARARIATKFATTTGRLIDFTQIVYVGETILINLPADSSVEIIGADGVKYNFACPYSDIDTSQWASGMTTAVISNGTTRVKIFEVINPIDITSKYNQLLKIIEEIDAVVEARLHNGGVLSTTINNKTLMNETLTNLYIIRSKYVKQANAELSKINSTSTGNPIKSITTFKRGY